MQSNRLDLANQTRDGFREQRHRTAYAPADAPMSLNPSANTRSDDSWVEISSQPSSSSLSSVTDEVVTTGLRVQHDSNTRRRRRLRHTAASAAHIEKRATSAGGSSQEEYEESESESDRVMTSSNEGLPLHVPLHSQSAPSAPQSTSSEDAAYEEDDEDENSTALGVLATEKCFTPQPNAFSHPPASQSSRPPPNASSYFPPSNPSPRPAVARHSDPGHPQTRQHTPYNMISPSYQANHDQALRASLSTLLSLGAAARGLPKCTNAPPGRTAPSSRIDPATIRMIPESALPGSSNPPKVKPPVSRQVSGHSSGSNSSADVAAFNSDKGKRKAIARSSSKDRRSAKKVRRMSSFDETVSPTLLTWVVSAGVVVLVSAISFSAGYAMGKEAGKAEVGMMGSVEGGSCGKEVMKGSLRRLRWTAATTAVTA